MSAQPMITTKELAEALGVSMKTVQRYRRAGAITPAVVLPGGHARWHLADVVAELAQHRDGPATGDE